MINMHFDTRANYAAQRWAQGLARANKVAVRKAFFDLGHQLKRDAQDEILHGVKSGRLYRIRRGKRIRNHRASAAGEAPANLSGALRRGVNFKITGSESMEFGYSDQTPYGRWLEEGTRYIDPRSNIEPTANNNHRNARTYFYQSLAREMRDLERESRRNR